MNESGSGRGPIPLRHGAPSRATVVRPRIACAAAALFLCLAEPPAFAAESCIDPKALADADIARYRGQIESRGFCVRVHEVADKGLTWTFVTVENVRKKRGPAWFLPHDNENSAFLAAMFAIERYGGKFLAVEAGEQRMFHGLDPNRHFGVESTAGCPQNGTSDGGYARFVLKQLPRGAILTLHNNGDGGPVSVSMKSDKETGIPAEGQGAIRDPDDVVFIAGRKTLADGLSRVEKLTRRGLNVVYEHVTAENNDCSLSNYAALKSRDYYNIDAQEGHTDTQVDMVVRLMSALGR